MAEAVEIHVDDADPRPRDVARLFAEVFASLDAFPRKLVLRVFAANSRGAAVSVDMAEGEPVFCVEGRRSFAASFRRRWIAEHAVPLVFPKSGFMALRLSPTSGNRVRVA